MIALNSIQDKTSSLAAIEENNTEIVKEFTRLTGYEDLYDSGTVSILVKTTRLSASTATAKTVSVPNGVDVGVEHILIVYSGDGAATWDITGSNVDPAAQVTLDTTNSEVTLRWDGTVWRIPPAAASGIPEAPTDGGTYVRKNAAWESFSSSSLALGSSVPQMNGTGAAGNATTASHENHVHPTDTSRASASDLSSHTSATNNPHSTTKSHVGLGSVDNTSDLNKPVSTATQTALDGKASTVHNHDSAYRPIGYVPTWTEITGKPVTFPPSTHGHAWDDITGKPSTFTPAGHSHTWTDMPNVSALSILGNSTESAAKPADISMGSLKTMLGLGTAAYQASTAFSGASHTHSGTYDAAGAAAAVQGNLDTHAGLGASLAHGGVVASGDSRLTNARTPTAHAASHANGGSDAITALGDVAFGSSGTSIAFNGLPYTSNPYTLSNRTGNYLTIACDATPSSPFAITYLGNFGFGLTNPSEKVEVNGNVKATSFLGSGASLTGITPSQIGAASASHTQAASTITGLDTAISANSDVAACVAAKHPALSISGAGGNGLWIGGTGGQVLALAQADATHNGALSAVMWNVFNGKADAHSHPYAATTHSHSISDITGLQTALDGKSSPGHAHAISDTTGLQTALDGKSATTHNHDSAYKAASYAPAWSEVTGKPSTFAPATHSHSTSETTGLDTALAGKASLTGATFSGDITTHRGNTTGALFLGNTGIRFLYYDGTNYVLNQGPLWVDTIKAGDYHIGEPTNTPQIVFIGDSLSTNAFVSPAIDGCVNMPPYNGQTFVKNNVAVFGKKLEDMMDDSYSRVSPLYNRKGGMNIAVIWAGTNDMVSSNGKSSGQIYSLLREFSVKLRRLGYKTVICSLTSCDIDTTGDTTETKRLAINTMLRNTWQEFADQFADLGSTFLGGAGAWSSYAGYYVDRIHFNNTGMSVIGPVVAIAVQKLFTQYGDTRLIGLRGSVGSTPNKEFFHGYNIEYSNGWMNAVNGEGSSMFYHYNGDITLYCRKPSDSAGPGTAVATFLAAGKLGVNVSPAYELDVQGVPVNGHTWPRIRVSNTGFLGGTYQNDAYFGSNVHNYNGWLNPSGSLGSSMVYQYDGDILFYMRASTDAAGPGTAKYTFLKNGNLTAVGEVTASKFNGSGAGLTGTAPSLTAGVATTANAVGGYTFDQDVKKAATPEFAGAKFMGDIEVIMPAAQTAGTVYLGKDKVRYLHYDGTQYVMPSADLLVNGYKAITTNTFASNCLAGGGSTATASKSDHTHTGFGDLTMGDGAGSSISMCGVYGVSWNYTIDTKTRFFQIRSAYSASTPFVIDSFGSVGLGGITDPTHKLEVTGNIKASGRLYGDALSLGTTSTSYKMMWSSSYGTGFLDFITTGVCVGATSGYDCAVWSGGAQTITCKADGKVGIKNPSPSEALDVTGNIKASAALQGASANIGGVAVSYTTSPSSRLVFAGDIQTHRGDASGVLYLGNAGNRYLYYDGTEYQLPFARTRVNSMICDGTLQSAGYRSADSTAGATQDVVISGTTLHFKNGLFVGIN